MSRKHCLRRSSSSCCRRLFREKLFFVCLLSVLGTYGPTFAGSNQSAVSILSSGESGIKLQMTPGAYPFHSMAIEGRSYLLFDGVVSGDAAGKPRLPSEGILVGIPMNADVSLEVVNTSYESFHDRLVAPAPQIKLDEDMNGHERYVIDEAAYSQNTWYPSEIVDRVEVIQFRLQRIAKILVHPYQYNPATQELKRLTSLTINLKFSISKDGESLKKFRPAGADPQFEEVYKSLLSNYEDAKKWRGIPQKSLLMGSSQDPSRDWFNPASPYLKLHVAKDGVYRLTPADLVTAGVSISGIDPRTFKVYSFGAQVPLFVAGESDGVFNSSDYIEFYGRRNYGRGEFFNLYTDTSAYWLTWGGTNGLRMVVEATDTTGNPTTYFENTIHLEEDEQYYFGFSAEEIIQPDNVPGEGWYWRDFSVGSPPTDFQFQIVSLRVGTGNPARLRVRFHGMTSTFPPAQHAASILLNGVNLGTASWNQNTERVFDVAFADSILRAGTNTLRVVSASPGGTNISRFYLDWYEVTYPGAFVASSNELTFSSAPGTGGIPTKYTVSGFQSSVIDVYNLTNGKKIVGGSVSSPSSGNFSIVFHDTGTASKRYSVVAEAQKFRPARIERKQFKDVRVNPSGADYIIITHELFKSAADRLASYRASQFNLRAKVVDLQDLYDEFNYGVFDPVAIKAFLRHAYDQWPGNKPAHVLLFGDASWDYKLKLSNTVKKNFIPGYGNPPTDNWFVAFDSANDLLPLMTVGRIPAETNSQAERYVDKLMQYDQTPPGEWTKRFLFITGGNTPGEKSVFNSQAENLISRYVTSPPVAGVPTRVYKTTDAIIDGENKQLIQDVISNGTIFLNFIGHSGGRIWGVDAGNPNDLRNTDGEFVFVTSVSCNVAAFADPRSNVLAEDFLLADQRAAVGCWAGSSLGYVDIGSFLSDGFLRRVAVDSLRGMGKLTTLARIDLWMLNHTSARFVAAIQLHPLLGDPLASLALPVKPDLAISASDVSFDPSVPTEIDSLVFIKSKIHNYGLIPKDSVSVRITDNFGGSETTIGAQQYRIGPVGFKDSLSVLWDVTKAAGNHVIGVQLDPANQIAEVTKANNRADLPVQVFAGRLLTIKPAASSVVPTGSQALEVISPTPTAAGIRYFFEVDSTPQFNGIGKIASPPVNAGIVSTRWESPPLTREGLYYWRSRTYDGRDSSAWVTSTFLVSTSPVPANTIRWRESRPSQFLKGEKFQADVTDSGVTIEKTGGVPLYVRSVGDRHDPYRELYSVIKVVNQVITAFNFIVGPAFFVADVNEVDGSFAYRIFPVASNPAMADSMAQFLQNLSPDRFIALTVVLDGFSNNNENLYSALESLGSRNIRSVRPGDAWAFLAQRRTGLALESYSKDAIAEVSYVIPSIYNLQKGTIVTAPIGPARRWQTVSWTNDAPSATSISLKILDARSNAIIDTLSQTVPSADLSRINSKTHPILKLQALLRSDFGTTTPVLKSWSIEYEGAPELATAPALVRVRRDSVLEGETMEFSAEVYNIGYTKADSVRVKFYTVEQNNTRKLFQSSRVDDIDAEKSKTAQATLNTAGRRGVQTLLVELDPGGLSELYSVNNLATRPFFVVRDTVPPQLEVTFDGVRIVDGDYVSPRPTVLIKLLDNSPLPVRDTTNATLRLDNRRVSYADNSQLTYSFPSSGVEKISIQYQPVLTDGTHTLLIDAQDASGNPASRTAFRIDFVVQSLPNLLNIYNYPNPFSRETHFTFNLSGSAVAEQLVIKIYTVAGRLIRSIDVPGISLRFGFNRVYWDGRDEDGNELANGVYLYTMMLRNGGNTNHVSAPQRMAKVR